MCFSVWLFQYFSVYNLPLFSFYVMCWLGIAQFTRLNCSSVVTIVFHLLLAGWNKRLTWLDYYYHQQSSASSTYISPEVTRSWVIRPRPRASGDLLVVSWKLSLSQRRSHALHSPLTPLTHSNTHTQTHKHAHIHIHTHALTEAMASLNSITRWSLE
jgi:hypothetical protein